VKLHAEFRKFMAHPSDFSETGESNRVTLWRAMMLSAIHGDSNAQTALLEQDIGIPDKRDRLVPPVSVDPSASLLDVAMQIYRAKLSAGEMTEPELAEMVRLLLAAEKDKALIFLKALGSKLQTLQSQQIERLLGAYEKDPAAFLGFVAAKVPEPDAMEVTPAEPIDQVAPRVAEEAKRAAEAQASADAVCSAATDDEDDEP
jgi:hypothetical protein